MTEKKILDEIVSLLKKDEKGMKYSTDILKGLEKCDYKIKDDHSPTKYEKNVGVLFFAFNEYDKEYDEMWISFLEAVKNENLATFYRYCSHCMNNLYIKEDKVHLSKCAKKKMIEGEDMKKLIEDKKIVFDKIGFNSNQRETVYSLTIEESKLLYKMLTEK